MRGSVIPVRYKFRKSGSPLCTMVVIKYQIATYKLILRNILAPLQHEFKVSRKAPERSACSIYTLGACHHPPANNRKHFAFSDVRNLITQAALHKDYVTLCAMLYSGQNQEKFLH